MLKLSLFDKENAPRRLLCLGAHSDDIEIGCGGFLLKTIEERPETEVCWVVFSADERRAEEARMSAGLFLEGAATRTIAINGFRDAFFPQFASDIKECFEKLRTAFSPDLILSHYRNDLHQDHRLISDMTWNTFRDHVILEYEVVKYDGDLGTPNVFVHLDERLCQKKIDYIRDSFKSQAKRSWFSDDLFLSILRIRGLESNRPRPSPGGSTSMKGSKATGAPTDRASPSWPWRDTSRAFSARPGFSISRARQVSRNSRGHPSALSDRS
jgi:LmbE family N-acetylglucosaminyl deacetylase